MTTLTFLVLLLALACFLLSAFHARPLVGWSDLGRVFLVGAVIVQFGPPS